MVNKRSLVLAFALVLVLALSNLGQALAQPDDMVPVLIGLKRASTTVDEKMIAVRGGIVTHRYHLIPAMAARVPERAIPVLRSMRQVAYVELDGRVEALQQTLPWGIDRIDAEHVHPYNKGAGVKIAIIDTGIRLNHPDLEVAGHVTFVTGTASGDDDHGHGTHVAGIAAARDNAIGVIGVAPEARLYAVKVLDSRGSGYWSDVVKGIEWAVDNGMDIINMSLGSSSGSTSLERACNNAYQAGVLLVAAAGNSGRSWSTSDTIVYPAKYASVIAVGATDSSDKRASWSSTGPALELTAPGVGIQSTYHNGAYATSSGTSMASPHVAGTAALIIASGITDDNGNGRISDEVRLRLQETAIDLGPAGRDREYGYGLVHAAAAVPPPPANRVPVGHAGEHQTVMVNTQVTLDGSGSYDPDGDPLTYQWNQTAGPEVTLSDGTAVSPTFTPTMADIYEFSLVVDDGELASLPDQVTVTVRDVNSPPTAPVVGITPGSPLSNDNLVCEIITPSTDPDGDPITYSYSWYKDDVVQPGLTSSTVHSSNTAKGETWQVVVTPNDGTDDGPSASDQVTIGNSPPVAHAGPDQIVMVNAQVTLDGSSSYDPDGDPLTHLWTQTAGPEVSLSDNTDVGPAFTPSEGGTYTFQLVVSDGSDSHSDSVSVYVSEQVILKMHIESINMTLVQRYGGSRTYALATVTVFDPDGYPVNGATVSGHWEGATSGSDSRTTNDSGQITFRSSDLRYPASGTTFIFVVDDLTKADWLYDAGANEQTRASIFVP